MGKVQKTTFEIPYFLADQAVVNYQAASESIFSLTLFAGWRFGTFKSYITYFGQSWLQGFASWMIVF
jgi:hypothetical protein